MNVTFRLSTKPMPLLDAADHIIINGSKDGSVGGYRASMYNVALEQRGSSRTS